MSHPAVTSLAVRVGLGISERLESRASAPHWSGTCTTHEGLEAILECSGASLSNLRDPEKQERCCAARSSSSALYVVAHVKLRSFASHHATQGNVIARWIMGRLAKLTAKSRRTLEFFGICAPEPCWAKEALWELVTYVLQTKIGPWPLDFRGLRFPQWRRGDIEFTPLLEARLRPVMRTCKGIGNEWWSDFRQKVCTQDGCDNYTRAGECFLYSKGFGSNKCYFRVGPDRWYCPVSAPLAALLPPKVGSTSNTEWLALMDDKLWYHAAQLLKSSLLGNCSGSKMWRKECEPGIHRLRNTIRAKLRGLSGCTPEHSQTLMTRAVSTMELTRGENMYVSGPYCHSCCATAVRRIRIVFVRNPFSRLASYYLTEWRHLMPFIQFLSGISCDDFSQQCKPHPFGRNERLHVKPVAHVLEEMHLPRGPGSDDLYVIHLEQLKRGMDGLVERMCERFGYCALPKQQQRNQGPGERKTDAVAAHASLVSAAWIDFGPGKCNGSSHVVLFSGSLPGGLERCKAECRKFPDCGFVSHGWSKDPSLCLVLSTEAPCADTKMLRRQRDSVRTHLFAPPTALWDDNSISTVLRWHAADFKAFGYSEDPSLRAPVQPLSERCGPFRLIS